MLISITVSVISVVIIGMKYNARKKVLISDTRYLAYPHPIPHTPHIHLILPLHPTDHRQLVRAIPCPPEPLVLGEARQMGLRHPPSGSQKDPGALRHPSAYPAPDASRSAEYSFGEW